MQQLTGQMAPVPSIVYKDVGSIVLSHKSKSQLQFMAALCKNDKIDAIDLYIQDGLICICGVSYLTNVYFFYTIKSLNKDLAELYGQGDKACASKEGTPILDVSKPIIRTSTTFDILSALAIYEEYTVLDVTESEVVLKADGTMLYFDRIRTMSEYDDYLDKITREDISEMSVYNILTMTRSLFTVKEDVYKRHVMLSGNKAYTHTTSFLAECMIKPVRHEYLLRYTMISVIDKIPRGALSTIGYRYGGGRALTARGQYMVVCVSGCYVSWDLSAPVAEVLNNLMGMLNRKKFSHILTINAKEWPKLDMLCKFSDKSATDVVTITTRSEGVFALYSKNKAYIRGTYQPGVTFDVELSLLKQARVLTGSKQPEMYVDYTGAQSILILKGEILVTIAISNFKVDSSGFKFAKTLEESVLPGVAPDATAQEVSRESAPGYMPELASNYDTGFVPSLPDDGDGLPGALEEGLMSPGWNDVGDDFYMPSDLMFGEEDFFTGDEGAPSERISNDKGVI